MKLKALLTTVILSLTLSATVLGATYYVSSSGSNSNSGITKSRFCRADFLPPRISEYKKPHTKEMHRQTGFKTSIEKPSTNAKYIKHTNGWLFLNPTTAYSPFGFFI